eukprot:Selendium_serpulae@DN3015_c0_g1_i1.p1
MEKYHPGYFGKCGMPDYHKRLNSARNWCPTINVDKLWSLVPTETRDKLTKGGAAGCPVIDVTDFGYIKVLAKGHANPTFPMIVKARLFSKKAEQKIKDKGGVCVLTA